MRGLLIALLVASTGCDRLFGLVDVSADEIGRDASDFDAIVLDTSGWPTDGGVEPRPCDPSAFDEDGDTFGDDCDNCPSDVNGAQRDDDRDGVGNVCDPNPKFAVERIAAFYSFRVQQGKAITGAGIWGTNEAEGTLRQSGGAMRTLYMLDGGPFRTPTVELKVSTLRRTESNNMYAGVVLSNELTTLDVLPDSIHCRSRVDVEGDAFLEMARVRNNGGLGATGVPYGGNATIHTLVIHAARHGGAPQCDGDLANLPPIDLRRHLVMDIDDTDSPMPAVAVWTMGGTADFLSAVVYETIWPP